MRISCQRVEQERRARSLFMKITQISYHTARAFFILF